MSEIPVGFSAIKTDPLDGGDLDPLGVDTCGVGWAFTDSDVGRRHELIATAFRSKTKAEKLDIRTHEICCGRARLLEQ